MPLLTQQNERALKSLPDAASFFAAHSAQALACLDSLIKAADSNALPMLNLPARKDDLQNLRAIAEQMQKRCRRVLVLGTGGSSLGAQTLLALRNHPFARELPCELHFVDNTDPHTLHAMMKSYDPLNDGVLAISKSGGTVETLVQFMILLDKAKNSGADLAKQFLVITVPDASPLRNFAEENAIPIINHDPKLGGRYSVLSEVGLLPAALAGLDIAAFRNGARELWEDVKKRKEKSAVIEGALLQVAAMRAGKSVSVMMPYCDRLTHFSAWYAQLWAESLGKSGKGSTALRAVGATDQHSQLQLFLDGPRDKFITFITLKNEGQGPSIPDHNDATLAYLKDHHAGDVIDAQARGTMDTLAKHTIPLREIRLDVLNEETLGALLMHFMLEVIFVADLIGVNAYDQPAVEESKVLAREYLAG